jgi:hypothetical protein
MSSIVEQMTRLYVLVDDFLKAHPALARWRKSPNATPAFTDAEVLTVGLMQGCLRVATLKQAHRLVAANWRAAFPNLPTYGQWLSRFHALSSLTGRLIQHVLNPQDSALYVMDSKPIPACKPIRHGRVRLMRDEGAAFGRGTGGWFFGFKLHLVIHLSGAILCGFLAPANQPDADFAPALAQSVDGGIALADRGYQGSELSNWFATEAGLLLITPGNCGEHYRPLVSSLRERIETTFSQLCERFVDRVYSRSFHGLWNSIKLKMLHLNLCQAGILPA